MTTSLVTLNQEFYNSSTNGQPLFNASVYVGEPDLDPLVLANRKTVNVVQEDGTIVPILAAAQPLTTNVAGRIVYAGSPVRITTDGNYSLKVMNSLGAQEYYIDNAFGPPLSTIGVLSSATLADAIARSDVSSGTVISLNERTAGNGGGIFFDVVLLSSVVVDNINVFASTGQVTLALVAREDGIIRGDNGDIYRKVACVLRNTGSGWFAIDDSGHKPIGVSSITETAAGIEINYSFTVQEVISTSCVADETLGSLDISAGCSVGLSKTTVSIFAPMRFLVNTDTGAVVAPSFYGTQITATKTGAVVSVSHPSNGNSAYGVQMTPESPKNTLNMVSSVTTVGFNITAYTEVAGLLTAGSGTWVYTGNMKNAPTTAFASNNLTVTHDTISSEFKAQLTARRNSAGDTFHLPINAGNTNTSFGVIFKDSSFNSVSVADNDMSFNFNRAAIVEAATITGQERCDAGHGLIIPADLVSGGGNFWFIGIFKVTSAELI